MQVKLNELQTQMTVAEKVSLLAGATMWTTMPIERLHIPAIKVTDGPNGARGEGLQGHTTSACFPAGIALASTWNTELVTQVGIAIAEEAKTKGAHVLLAPTVNIHRSPLNGRNFECYSEDPYLSSRMAVAYIQGVQSQGVSACVKHFVCNDSEFERQSISSEVSERALHEIYLPPFKAAVQEANSWAIMSAYNKLNGTYCSEHPQLLRTILKEAWGFDGLVMSDWFGTYSTAAAAGGLDLEMPGPARWFGQQLIEAIQNGVLDESIVDDKVSRLLRLIQRTGAFDQPEPVAEQAIDKPEHRQVAYQAAVESIVLLKNEADVLPLQPQSLQKIAIIGPNARVAQIQGGGSAGVTPHYVVTPYDGMMNKVGDQIEIGYELGCTNHKLLPVLTMNWVTAVDQSRAGLTLEFFNNAELAESAIDSQVTQKGEFIWFGDPPQEVGDLFSARLRGTFTAPRTGTYHFSLVSAGLSRLSLDGQELVDNWTAQRSGEAYFGLGSAEEIASIELKSGQPYDLVVEFTQGAPGRPTALRIGCLPPIPAQSIEAAATLAAKADVALVFVGLTNEWESESYDRKDMTLPGRQAELIEAVATANEKTIVILNTGSPITMPWLAKVTAVIQAWYPGQEAGNAIADILFGDVNPSGKLPQTFPKRLQDNPAYINYPGENGRVYYGEGVFVGYRYYEKKEIEPLFPFGYGLSYTTFTYDDLVLDTTEYAADETIQARATITNSGSRAGQEIVQLYLHDVESRLVRPEKELKSFTKIALAPGETKTITLSLTPEARSFYDPAVSDWVAEAGEFEIRIGRSASDIRLTSRFTITAVAEEATKPQARLHTGLTLRTLLADSGSQAILAKHFGDMLQSPQVAMAMDMTLTDIARFAPQFISATKLQEIETDLANVPE